jgi:Flp pilus assembly protein TadG
MVSLTSTRLSRFIRDKGGNAVIVFSLAAPVTVGGAGLAVDYSMWSRQKAALQATADSAALAASFELAKIGTSAEMLANAEAAAKGFAEHNSSERSVDVVVDVSAHTAKVTLAEPAIVNFGRLFSIEPFLISASSEAQVDEGSGERACILALDETAKTGVTITGTALFDAQDCRVHSNALGSQSMVFGGSATIRAKSMTASGTAVTNGSSVTVDSTIASGVPRINDPLDPEPDNPSVNWKGPTPGPCTKRNLKINVDGDYALPSGTYCSGASITAKGSVTLSGQYVFTDGPVKITADGSVTGMNVSLFLTGSRTTLDISGQADVKLSAPNLGTMDGIVLASDPAQTGTNLQTRITVGASVDLSGTIYLPNQDFVWRGNTRVNRSVITQVIARTVDIAGTTEIIYEADAPAMDYPEVLIRPMIAYLAK